MEKIFPDVVPGGMPCGAGQLEDLTAKLSRIRSLPVPDCEVLQKLDFLYSYEVITCLEKNPPPGTRDLLASWKRALIKLDEKAQLTNGYFDRPSARWLIRKGREIPAQPTKRMLAGYIEREDRRTYISEDGRECHGSKKGCEKIRYVLIKCLVPGFQDPEKARAALHEYPPAQASPDRMVKYLEVPLSEKNCLIRRNYYMKPFPGYKGMMENYYHIAFQDNQRLIILEQNTRVGKFILRTDNAGIYIKSPPHGVIVSMIFSGKFIMESFFRVLVGNKLLVEPAQVLSILRQHMMHPDRTAEENARIGLEDFEDKESLK